MRRSYLFTGAALAASILCAISVEGQTYCPGKIGYQTTDPCYPTVNAPAFYMNFYSGIASGTLTATAEFENSLPGCGTIGMHIANHCYPNYGYDANAPCTMTNPTGKITFTNGLVCHYQEGNLVKCGDFLVPCTDELLHFVQDHISVPGLDCKQWEGPCNSESEIYRTGAVAIGTNSKYADLSRYKLTVRGGIASEMLQICKGEWCDYVFSDSFHLMPLPQVSQYIQSNKHLPGCTPGPVIERAGGFSLGDQTVQQQEKIEEGFLHLIALRKRLDALSAQMEQMGLPSPTVAEPTLFLQGEANTEDKHTSTAAPVISIECYQIQPAIGDETIDGRAGIRVSGGAGLALTVSWSGPVSGSMNITCPDGLVVLNGLKKGTYTVTVSVAGGTPQTCTLIIAKGTPVSCAKLGEEPCKSEIYKTIKNEISETEPTCKQWESTNICSTSGNLYRLGNVGIGTSVGRTGYSLAVKGGIITDRFFIELCETSGWCDYVFDPAYHLSDLYEVEQHIQDYRHLPGTVSQAEVTKEGGFELRSVKLDQQKKIEESYLYLIEMNKKVEALKNRIQSF